MSDSGSRPVAVPSFLRDVIAGLHGTPAPGTPSPGTGDPTTGPPEAGAGPPEAAPEPGAAPGATPETPAPTFVRPEVPRGMFVSLEEQLDNIRRWNTQKGWGFQDADWADLDLVPGTYDEALVTDVLAVYLPGDSSLDAVRRTCDELWGVLCDQYPNAWCWDQKCWDLNLVARKHVRLLHGIPHRPGIRRVTLDLGAHWDPVRPKRAIDIRGRDSGHAEVLAAAAHFPEWVRAMDGLTVPFTLLAGYQVTLVEQESWRRLPCLSWNESRATLSLTAHWADIYAPRWSSPVLVTGVPETEPDTTGALTWA